LELEGYVECLRELREIADKLSETPGEARQLLSRFLAVDEALAALVDVELDASRNLLDTLAPAQATRLKRILGVLNATRSIKQSLALSLRRPPPAP
jgi:Mg/Co/Ni transporter MgtE